MRYYTLDDIMALNPCHNREKLEVYMDGRKRISLSGIFNSKARDADKIWLVVRLIPTSRAVEFAQWCADSVKHLDSYYSTRAARYADAAADAADDAAAEAARVAAAAVARAAYTDTARAADAYTSERLKQVNKLRELI